MASASVLGARAGDVRARLELERLRRDREDARLAALSGAFQQGIHGAIGAGQVGADIYATHTKQKAMEQAAADKAEAERARLAAEAEKAKQLNAYREQQIALKRQKIQGEAAARIFGAGASPGGAGGASGGSGGVKGVPAVDDRHRAAWESVDRAPTDDDGPPVAPEMAEEYTKNLMGQGARLIAKGKNEEQQGALRRKAEAYSAATGVPVEQAMILARANAGPDATEAEEMRGIQRARSAIEEENRRKPLETAQLRAQESEARQKVLPEIEAAAGVAGTAALAGSEDFDAAREALLSKFAHLENDDIVDTAILNDAAKRGMDAAKLDKLRAHIEALKAKAAKDRRVPGPKGAAKPEKSMIDEIQSLDNSITMFGDVRSRMKAYTEKPGILNSPGLLQEPASKFIELFVTDVDRDLIRQNVSAIDAEYKKMMSGATVSEKEALKLEVVNPQMTDPTERFFGKLDARVAALQRWRDYRVKTYSSTRNLDVFGGKTSANAPTGMDPTTAAEIDQALSEAGISLY